VLPSGFLDRLAAIAGPEHVRTDPAAREIYSVDGLKREGHPPDAVVLPGSTAEVSAILRACDEARVPVVPRGAGTGYTGGAVPVRGGLVLSLERFTRILEIDRENLLAVVEPNVVTGELQAAVERVGLFYPPDPASLGQSAIGGNVAECAGGPRAFKYGTTRRYVLGLEAVLPTGEIVRTGSKAVKNVVGYDLTQLLVGSEGTLAVITRVTLRLVPKPPARATLRAAFASIDAAVAAVSALVAARVVPSAIELVDRASLEAIARYVPGERLAPAAAGAVLLIEVDGMSEAVAAERRLVADACRTAGAQEVVEAADEAAREALWRLRRELSPALKTLAPLKLNHDVVVPKGRIPQLFALVEAVGRRHELLIACFGHAGDGNIHVNILLDPAAAGAMTRARLAERELFEGVVALEGSISGEHGIGFTKAPYLGLELAPEQIALMKRIKAAFDPHGILNPGKIFPE
jgi:glycolate oxidase